MNKKSIKKNRYIPTKNYIKLAIICIITLFLTFYANSWYINYKINRLNTPYIIDKISTIKYSEFNNYVIENPNLIVYVGKNDNQKCYDFEKKLYNVLKDNNLIENSIFLNLSDNYSEKILDEIEKNYYTEDLDYDLNSIPALLMIQDKKVSDILVSYEGEELTSDKIIQFLEEFEYIK